MTVMELEQKRLYKHLDITYIIFMVIGQKTQG